MRIFTHFSVDLDAVSSVWAWRTFVPGYEEAEILFRPANWDGSEMEEGDVALDLDAKGKGLKGEKGENGEVHSCLASIVVRYASEEDQTALRHLVAFVDAQDAYGSAARHLVGKERPGVETLEATGLNAVLRALQAVRPRDDAWVVEQFSLILNGFLKAGRARLRAEKEADRAELIGNGQVAICRDNREFATNGILFERGVRVIVYQDGYNLGLIRAGDEELRMDDPELRAVVEAAGELNEWFAHPAGFLFCRGSRKAPAETPSRVDPRKLAEAADSLLC